MLKLADLCPGRPEELPEGDPLGPVARRCACGLTWDPDRGPHTHGGLRITDEVVERLFDREAARLRAEAIRLAAALADDERRAAIAKHVKAGLEAMRWERRGRP